MNNKLEAGETFFFFRYEDAKEHSLLTDIDSITLADERLKIKIPSKHGTVMIQPVISDGQFKDYKKIKNAELLINIPVNEVKEATNFEDDYAKYLVKCIYLKDGKYYEKSAHHEIKHLKLLEFGVPIDNSQTKTVMVYPSPVENGKLYINTGESIIRNLKGSLVDTQNRLFNTTLGAGFYELPHDESLPEKYSDWVAEFSEILPDVWQVTNKNYFLYSEDILKQQTNEMKNRIEKNPIVFVAENPLIIYLNEKDIPENTEVTTYYALRRNFFENQLTEHLRVINQNAYGFKEITLDELFN